MSLPALWQSSLNYKISTEVYEGPLDLLLHLIEQAELDITKLALAKVTDQYLAHLHSLAERDPVEVSAFLVIAAKLVFIKSSILLPSQENPEKEEEDLGDQLARQLVEYKKYKEIALWMKERETSKMHSFYRVGASPKYREILDIAGLTPEDLVDILLEIYFQHENLTPLSDVVAISPLTIKKRIREIVEQFRTQRHQEFSAILGKNPTRLELVVTFLALLELIKHHTIQATQEAIFGDIALECIGSLEGDFDTEL